MQMEAVRMPMTKDSLDAILELLMSLKDTDTIISVLNETERNKMHPPDYTYNFIVDSFLQDVRNCY
jgi:hypothetical protein